MRSIFSSFKVLSCLMLAMIFAGCDDEDINLDSSNDSDSVVEVDSSNGTTVSTGDGTTVSTGTGVTTGTVPPSGNSTLFFIPDNCDNPPTQLSANDGFTCIASRTRNDSLVCLLPHQFTWPPLTPFTDDAGITFGCNANDDFFDEVTLFLTTGEAIRLVEAGCFNFVATANGQVGRQHWRNEGIQFSSVQSRFDFIVMTRDGQDTCLRF